MRRVLIVLVLAAAGCLPDKKADEPAVARKVECRRAAGPIKLDGVPDEPAWAGAAAVKEFAAFWKKRPAKTATTARLLWDDRFLYFAAEMEDADLFALTKERNGMTWDDDVFELFFKPRADQPAYYEFQVNALNTHLELGLPSRGAGGYRRFAPLTKVGMESAVKLKGTLNDHADKDTGWAVEGRIPWKGLRLTGGPPDAGDVWRFALCRYDYSAA
ncbi:MAG: carbohydrate-binding family 9-like protein, partial [Gemmataceae bacterium]